MASHNSKVKRRSGVLGLPLLAAALLLMGQSDCPAVDEDEDGYSPFQGDCDDQNPDVHPDALEMCNGVDDDCDGSTDEEPDGDGDGYSICFDCDDIDPNTYPGAEEVCDGLPPGEGVDNDCDGEVDEDLEWTAWYPDEDQDGYGVRDESLGACEPPSGYVRAVGDCDDGDRSVYPGAEDEADDGIDQDCGGTDGTDPHVGLSESSASTIQEAIDSAASGNTVWVGPGTYREHDIRFNGKAMMLASTHGSALTIIDANRQGRGLMFEGDEGPDTVVRGFTITRGLGERGGGVRTYHASPTLEFLTLLANEAVYTGGGIGIAFGAPVIRDTVVDGNRAPDGEGGGLFADSAANVTLERVSFRRNTAQAEGGGLHGTSVTLSMTECVFQDNTIDTDTSTYLDGGGMYLSGAIGSLVDCRFEKNEASGGRGGGAYIEYSEIVIRDGEFTENSAGLGGGGLYVLGGQIDVLGGSFTENSSPDGGGAFLNDTVGTVSGCRFIDNDADAGGGLRASGFAGEVSECEFTGNTAETGGGLLALVAPDLVLAHSEFTRNRADDGAGASIQSPGTVAQDCVFEDNIGTGLHVLSSAPTILRSLFHNNQGGGVMLELAAATIRHCTVVDNRRYGIQVNYATPVIDQTVMAYNDGYDLESVGGAPRVTYSNVFDVIATHNLQSLGATNLTEDPLFARYTNDGDPSNDDYHLLPSSPMNDAGDPAERDPDDTVAAIGMFGGPDADWSYYTDADADGLFDGWEEQVGLDPTVDDSGEDPDGDGANNGAEFNAQCDPKVPDMDGDGAVDGDEIVAASDPLDWYSQPSVEGVAQALVPGDFATIQEAIDATVSAARIEVGPGSWREDLTIVEKQVSLTSSDGYSSTILEGNGGWAISARFASLSASGFTVSDSSVNPAGGARLEHVVGEFGHMRFSGNTAYWGGGIELDDSSPFFRQCQFVDNTAYQGGGGIFISGGAPVFEHCLIEGNTTSCLGNACFGGGVYASNTTARFENCTIKGNSADYGGGMYLGFGDISVEHSVVVANEAISGDGLYISSSAPTVSHSIIAHLEGDAIFLESGLGIGALSEFSYSDVYGPMMYEDLPSTPILPDTNLTVEPGFLAYAGSNEPSDVHLALDSQLLDVGSDIELDPDASPSDPGVYGGPAADSRDLDDDGVPDYFWPGKLDDAPSGFLPEAYDCDDLDPEVQRCPDERQR